MEESIYEGCAEQGVSMLDYVLLVSLIGAVIIAAVARFQEVANKQYSVVEATI